MGQNRSREGRKEERPGKVCRESNREEEEKKKKERKKREEKKRRWVLEGIRYVSVCVLHSTLFPLLLPDVHFLALTSLSLLLKTRDNNKHVQCCCKNCQRSEELRHTCC